MLSATDIHAATRLPVTSRRLSAVALISLAAGTASAGINSWNNASGGFWDDPSNWSLGSVPEGFGADAEISLAGAYTVTIQTAPTVGSLSLLNASADIAINNGRSLTVNSDTEATATLINDGLITVNAGQGAFFTQLGLGDADTAGILAPGAGMSGEVVLNLSDGNGDFNDSILTISGGGEHALGHTVRGKGRVAGLFVNNGLLLADRDGQELRVSGAVTQGPTGVVSATGNGRLSIGDSGSLSGGVFTGSTGGVLSFQSGLGTIGGGLHLMGDAEVANGTTMNIGVGGITNDGTFTVNATQGSFTTQAIVTDFTSLLGTGNVDLNMSDGNGDYNDAVLTTAAGITATNGPDHSVNGKGQLAGSWVNAGTIEADRDGQELRISAAVVQTASGIVGATNNGVLGISGGGSVSGGTVVTASGGSVQSTAGTALVDGGLHNLGDMGVRNGQALAIGVGGIVNDGDLSVNSNQGTNTTDLRFDQNVTVSGSGRIDLNIGDVNGDYNDARVTTAAGVTGTFGPDQTVSGKGRLNGTFINNGTILGDRPGQDVRMIGTVDQSGGGTARGTNGGFAVLEGVAITGGFFDGDTGGAVQAAGGGNSISGVTSLGAAGIRNGGNLRILAGGMTNDGVFSVNSQPGVNGTQLDVAEDATIDGTGRIDLNLDDGNNDFADAQFRTVEGAVATNAADHTVSGKGRMNGDWINEGTITADRPGQDLQLLGFVDQSGGGQIRGDDGFAVLFGVDVIGGTFDSSGAGAVLAQGSAGSISGVINLGEAGLRNGAALSLDSGGLTNDGTFTVNSSQGINGTVLSVRQNAEIDGSGDVVLNLSDSNTDFFDARIATEAGITLTLGENQTVRGKGRLTGTVINNGTIAADRAGQDLQVMGDLDQTGGGETRADNAGMVAITANITGGTFDSDGTGSVLFAPGNSSMTGVTNNGTAGLRSGASVVIGAGGITNNGTFTVNSNAGISGTIAIAEAPALIDGSGTTVLGLDPGNGDFFDARLGADPDQSLTFGPDQTLAGRGRLSGEIELQGTFAPGAETVDTIIARANGDTSEVRFTATSTYHVHASAEEVNDTLDSTVAVDLQGGTIRFTPIDGFEPPRPTRYTIITAPEITGTFGTLIYDGVVPEGGIFRVVYEDTEVIAAVTCKADIAAPIGILDLNDITYFTQLFLAGSLLVDLNDDGLLDLADIGLFIQEFLAGCG